jgi:hypothetical protein
VFDHDLATLDNAANLFVHPSIFERVGLPVLEAMRHTCANVERVVAAGALAPLPTTYGCAGDYYMAFADDAWLEPDLRSQGNIHNRSRGLQAVTLQAGWIVDPDFSSGLSATTDEAWP